ncbi:MAG TPA: cytochrome c biogenesis protein CcsA [Azospirillaceae bacterium]|nr:cytochrome c biogenesis protein CcsA [Azospirillaceae bacterium]
MTQNLLFSLSALFSLVPASILTWRRGPERDRLFWVLLLVAMAGPLVWAFIQVAGAWHAGLSTALWVTIAATMVIFVALSLKTRSAWRLSPVLFPYLVLIATLATLALEAPQPLVRGDAPRVWLQVHILVSVTTYALVTLASVAALAAFLQERALKKKRPTTLTRSLPPMAESESLQVRLLTASEIVLGLGLLTGMAVLYYERGHVLALDHKTLLSLATFAVIGVLLTAHAKTGVRGRAAGRLVLLAYLLLTLAYPGVKFVSDVLIGHPLSGF